MKQRIFIVLIASTILVNRCLGRECVSDLYFLKMDSLTVPKELIQKAIGEKNDAFYTNAFIYVEIFKNDKRVWRLPMRNLGDSKDGKYTFDNGTMNFFPLLWKSQDSICCKVFVADKEVVAASKGGLAGAKAAAYPAYIAWLYGPLYGPPHYGTFTGDIIAAMACGYLGVRGYMGGDSFLVAGAKEVATFVYEPSDKFNLCTTKKSVALSQDKNENPVCAQVSFSGRKMTARDCVKADDLRIQEVYLVRFSSLFISAKNSAVKKGAEYYVVLDPTGSGKDLLEFDLGSIALDEVIPLEVLALVKNQGGNSRIRVYRRIKYWKDKCVFEGVHFATNGGSWVYPTTYKDDFGSYCAMETFKVSQ